MRESERYGRKVIENLRSYSSRAILVRLIVGKMLRNVIVFRQPQSFCTKATKSRAQTHPPSAHHALAVRAGGADVSRLRESAVPPQGKRHPSCGKLLSRLRETSFPPPGRVFPACGKRWHKTPTASPLNSRSVRRTCGQHSSSSKHSTECANSTVVDGRQCSRATPSFG